MSKYHWLFNGLYVHIFMAKVTTNDAGLEHCLPTSTVDCCVETVYF